MQSSVGQSESETASHLPPMAHALVSHTVASWRSWFWPYKHMALQANVSANAKEHSSLCSVCVLGGKEVKAWISLLVTCYSFVLSFSSVFPLVLIYSHHHWALPPRVGCWSVLDATHTELFALFFFFFFSFPPYSWLFVFSSFMASKGRLNSNYSIQMKGNVAFGRSSRSLSRSDTKLWISWRFFSSLSFLFFLAFIFSLYFPNPN